MRESLPLYRAEETMVRHTTSPNRRAMGKSDVRPSCSNRASVLVEGPGFAEEYVLDAAGGFGGVKLKTDHPGRRCDRRARKSYRGCNETGV